MCQNPNCTIKQADLKDKALIVGQIGMGMLSCGTGAWRIREAMNIISAALGISCDADIGLVNINYTCFDANSGESHSTSLTIPTSGVNTAKLSLLEEYIANFEFSSVNKTLHQISSEIENIEKTPILYRPWQIGLAAGFACASFVFLLGGHPIAMLFAFLGAGAGSFTRAKLLAKKLMPLVAIAISVTVACTIYRICVMISMPLLHLSAGHITGYIGAMLFVIPGFPLITSGLDLAKQDMRSGIERFFHALIVIIVATIIGWMVASVLHLAPRDFTPMHLNTWLLLALRLFFGFFGVFGFSIMFNSTVKMAASAGIIGTLANALRLALIGQGMFPAPATFIGAMTAGLLAVLFFKQTGFPRISLTVPSLVIMVPGLDMYKAFYYLGNVAVAPAALWISKAIILAISLPLGLTVARVLTDPRWRSRN
ncbi:hypothetical protein IV53_GL000770 [Ligilactobacillus ceti DSM 22408]|uniref:Uncharacterized protein n=2 Tax=Ligilactobacillus TaxID=2767887 RepID=A0A0R2KHH8_9LACO|nr:hypothetical protein IV53_GL000770 [Ligilactobacillus ceti DSM 22408]